MSAIVTTTLALLPPGQVLAYSPPVYGGTHAFFEEVLYSMGVEVVKINGGDLRSAAKILKNIGHRLGMLFLETPANPTLKFVDLRALSAMAKENNPDCVVACDNTFMGIFQRPFKISPHIDVIIYSGTKFFGGHARIISGITLVRKGKEDLLKKVMNMRTVMGTILYPSEANELIMSIGTYEIRMKEEAANATKVAKFLVKHPKVVSVLHPSVLKPNSPDYKIYHRDCTGPSSIITFYLKTAEKKRVFRFLNEVGKYEIILQAVSLGGIESLMTNPATTTHSEMSEVEQKASGITINLIRLSVGLEDPEDLIAILKEALAKY